MVHKPIEDAMKLLDAKAAVAKRWDRLNNLLAWDLKRVKPKSEVVQQARKD